MSELAHINGLVLQVNSPACSSPNRKTEPMDKLTQDEHPDANKDDTIPDLLRYLVDDLLKLDKAATKQALVLADAAKLLMEVGNHFEPDEGIRQSIDALLLKIEGAK